jgi:hypothetical protein
MPFWTTAAIIGGAALSAGTSILGANKQASAADQAAQLNYKAQEDALAYQKQKDAQSRADLAPWLKAGSGAITSLSSLLNTGGFPDWKETFQAPTDVTEQNDPGFQARLKMGSQALERSAAARGGVLSGGTAKALTNYAQDYASNEYSNVYGRAFNEYATRYNQFQNNQTNKFNRYATISGVGQQSANQLGYLGQQSAGNVGNILMQGSQYQGNAYQNAAYQRASGYNSAAGSLSNLLGYYGQPMNPNPYTDPSYSYGR